MKIGKQKSLNLSCKKFTFCKLLIYALLLFLGTISVNSYAQNKNVPKTSPRIKEKENCSYRIIKNTSGGKLSSNILEDIDAHRKFSENYLWAVNNELEILIYPTITIHCLNND